MTSRTELGNNQVGRNNARMDDVYFVINFFLESTNSLRGRMQFHASSGHPLAIFFPARDPKFRLLRPFLGRLPVGHGSTRFREIWHGSRKLAACAQLSSPREPEISRHLEQYLGLRNIPSVNLYPRLFPVGIYDVHYHSLINLSHFSFPV